MKKIPVILCALLLAGLGIIGAFQHTSMEAESIPAEREKSDPVRRCGAAGSAGSNPRTLANRIAFEARSHDANICLRE